ncbi:MAG: Gfo/Idh/MocA family oxidoreductase [Chloroflexi bacterium]|nr:Gfo/Idh/MocA family oxidoreductase [Chloroflexota bacterium]
MTVSGVQQGLRIGVAGCGQMGHKHAINCSRIADVLVCAVADEDMERASTLAQRTGARPYQSSEMMIAEGALDAVVVATPPGARRDIVMAATAAGAAVLAEKPIALDMATAEALCAAAEKAAVVNAVGFHLRYSPLTQRARALISGRHLTLVRTLTTTGYYLKMDMPHWFLQRRHSGGPLLEQSLHMIDAARYLAGEITHVFGQGDRLVCPEARQFDSEDTLVLAYRFASGALGTHTDSCATLEFNWEIELFGPDWRLLVDYARHRLRGYVGKEAIDEVEGADLDLHMLEVQAFASAVRQGDGKLIRCDFADSTRTLAVLLAGDRSLRTGMWEPTGQ